ncbi:MAG: sugar ABC transporter permease [Clostridiales bacterium]|nr:sugar ABC transporter permease [Clostridiales bacterium]
MKKNKAMIICFITPALITFALMYLYPVIRTILMSFFKVESATAGLTEWSFNGLSNYISLFKTDIFVESMKNIAKIWIVGGVAVLSLSLLFAVILTSGVRGKNFFRAVIYLPNVISAVALANMWIQFVFNKRYGLIHSMGKTFGIKALSGLDMLSSDTKFWAMLIAYCFGAVGYYMLIFLSGIERIPSDIYEAATLDGATKPKQFTLITLPLLKGVFKTNITFWSVNTISFYVWSQMFSPVDTEKSTVVPVLYMMDIVFGSKTGSSVRDAGKGAAIGVTLAVLVIIVFFIFNKLIKEEEVEY